MDSHALEMDSDALEMDSHALEMDSDALEMDSDALTCESGKASRRRSSTAIWRSAKRTDAAKTTELPGRLYSLHTCEPVREPLVGGECQVGPSDGTRMVLRWHSDGTQMALGWYSDGTRMVLRWHSDGTQMPGVSAISDKDRRWGEGWPSIFGRALPNLGSSSP